LATSQGLLELVMAAETGEVGNLIELFSNWLIIMPSSPMLLEGPVEASVEIVFTWLIAAGEDSRTTTPDSECGSFVIGRARPAGEASTPSTNVDLEGMVALMMTGVMFVSCCHATHDFKTLTHLSSTFSNFFSSRIGYLAFTSSSNLLFSAIFLSLL
jgi:hypothetical protein